MGAKYKTLQAHTTLASSALGHLIAETRMAKRLRLRDIEARVGLGRNSINQIENGQIESMMVNDFCALASVFKLKPTTFFSRLLAKEKTFVPHQEVYYSFKTSRAKKSENLS